MSKDILKTVRLDRDKCIGCITCMRRCPTEAIRIVDGKAKILDERCINCGECIRSCSNGAKRPVYDPFETVEAYKYKVALTPPSLYGQFNNLDDVNYVIEGLYRLGFDKVIEVGVAAELVTDYTKKLINTGSLPKPAISSACPAIVDLILLKYHQLANNLVRVQPPAVIAAKLAHAAAKKAGYSYEETGVFFISPCPAKVYELKKNESNYVSGVLSQSEVYFKLLNVMKDIDTPKSLAKSSYFGLGWGHSGGESNALGLGNYIHCAGISNCVSLLNEIEDGKLDDVDFIEMNMCPAGCVGGVLNIENAFVARSRMCRLADGLRSRATRLRDYGVGDDFFKLDEEPELINALQLDSDVFAAMEKMTKVEEYLKLLPGVNCGDCGSPTCRCYAEDVVISGGSLNCPKMKAVNGGENDG